MASSGSKKTQSVSPLAPLGIDAALKAKEDPTFAPRPKIFDEFALTDRVGLVSGGNRGLGLEMAIALAEAGARVVYCFDLLEEPSEEFKASRDYVSKLRNGSRLEYFCADVREQELLWKKAEEIGDREQRFDFCVAAAGILKPHKECLDYPAQEFRDVLDVNTTGVLFTAQAAGRQMARFGHGGSIVLIASMSGSITNRDHAWVSYNTSKSAVLQMARSMACELGPQRIRVNTLSPGHIYTQMTAAYLDKEPELLNKWSSMNPLGRLGRPDEMRGVVTWLASDASSFCTGSDKVTADGQKMRSGLVFAVDPMHSKRPQPTDIAERIVAFQRKNANATRRSERPLPPSPESSPRKPIPVPRTEADPDDFNRRLKISPPNRTHQPSKQQHRLYNPETDPIPVRRTHDPEPVSDATSSSYVPRNTAPSHHRDPPSHHRLFDHRKDDPVRFSVLARPSGGSRPILAQKPSPDVSASSTSSYAHSMASSSFTLSSGTTDNSSASSALFDGKPRGEELSNNAFAVQLKKLYRSISALESKILSEDTDENPDESRVLLHGRARDVSDEELEQQKWLKLISDHKRLADMMHNMMEISLSPSVPASLRVIPAKYNIIIRLWTHAFHKLLEALRRASFSSPLALEHLQEFIYFAYTFYTGLLEEPLLKCFRSGWLEALGDLARYRMAVAAMVTSNHLTGPALTMDALAQVNAASADNVNDVSKSKSQMGARSSSYRPAARIDNSPTPSVGIIAARMMQVEPEKERWRGIAKEWYAHGIADTPGAGKLHHHLGLLSREVENEELRAVYHFVKSMTTLHPFSTSRESILPVWSSTAQSRRSQPDATTPELFVLLHGMLFTNIELDDFSPTLSRFLERLEIEGAEERQWIMMAVTNISAILEYGRPGVLRRVSGAGTRDAASTVSTIRVVAKRNVPAQSEQDPEEKRMDVDEDASKSDMFSENTVTSVEFTQAFRYAMQLLFSMLSLVLRNPTRKASPFLESTLNPYLTVVLTFLVTVSKHVETLTVLERFIPWEDLAVFFASIPKNIHTSQGLHVPTPAGTDRWAMLTSGCAPPLPEDWCMRGMEWVGRKVFERGYWKSGEDRRMEIEVLDTEEGNQLTDGIIQDDDADERGGEMKNETVRRWMRIARTGVNLAALVDGFTWVEGTREWKVDGALEAKVRKWRDEYRREREQDEVRRQGRRWTDDAMDVDAEDAEVDESSEGEDDEEDSEEIKALKARRRYLRSLLASAQRLAPSPPIQRSKQHSRRSAASAPTLNVVPGYSLLVLDTNILLSSLSIVASIIESLRWTVVIPVPVIMELDGLCSNMSQLGEAAQEAVAYITSHIRSHATSLKVQTSKGNYLTSLSVRTEQVEFSDEASWDRCMDDLILKAAIWQDEHWVDRSALLKGGADVRDTSNAVKVVLLSLDRNLRLKARSRQLSAADEKDLAAILACGT